MGHGCRPLTCVAHDRRALCAFMMQAQLITVSEHSPYMPASLLCSKKLGTPVPRLDLTPVLATMAAEQDGTPDTGPGSHSHGVLMLEDAPRRRLELDDDTDETQQQGHSKRTHATAAPITVACSAQPARAAH